MEGRGGEVEEGHDGCSKRVRDEEHDTEGEARQDGGATKRRIRSENWSAGETLQMLELRKGVVGTSTVKGSGAWNQIAQQLADMNPKSQARSGKQVAQRWDTLVRVYVSIEEECCERGRTCGEVIDERQQRCKTEYREVWHELIAQGNPGKRRPGKAAVQADEAPGSLPIDIGSQASAASLLPGASQAVMAHVLKFGEIAKPLAEMLDTIKVANNDLVLVNGSIVTGSKHGRGFETTISVSGLGKEREEMMSKVARATQSVAGTMQRMSEAAATSTSFYLEVDKQDWSVLERGLSALSLGLPVISGQGRTREEAGEAAWIPNMHISSASWSTHDHHNNATQHTLSLTSPATSTDTFAGLSDVVPLSPGFSDVMPFSPVSVGTSAALDDLDVFQSHQGTDAGTNHGVIGEFDVFLNHRGPDVKATFVMELEADLQRGGFRPFLDILSLTKGDPPLQSIQQALDMAKVHVAIVCKGYAESKYCLNELVAMVRSGKPVIPVFFDVEPVDLRWVEYGPFAAALDRHKAMGGTEQKLREWRYALRALAEITGFCLGDYRRDEAKLKQEVVKAVARLTPSGLPVEVVRYRVGLEGRAQFCMQKLEGMGAGVGMLGLVGMGGVGKSTLAGDIYNRLVAAKKFRTMTFLEVDRDPATSNVRVTSAWSKDLRKQLLWDVFRVRDDTSGDYGSWFRRVSTPGPVLVVVDGVDRVGQFEALIPFACDLHPGSRIIVTSRDRSILNNVAGRTGVDHYLFDVATLGSEESDELFNWHCFQDREAPDDYKDVAKDVVEACGGLPLALKVIGSSLFDKRSDGDLESIWPEARDALRQSGDVMSVLRWSYDKLPKAEKSMFVDVTCMFYKESVKEALAYWRSCKGCASCGGRLTVETSLRNLVNKSMVAFGGGGAKFRVHELLVELGQEAGMEAKTHFVKDGCAEAAVMRKRTSSKTVALNLGSSRKRKFGTEEFENMPNLHYLVLPDGCIVCGKYNGMWSEIRWLQWRNMPLRRVPTNLLSPSHVIGLDFSESTNLASLWSKSDGSLEGFPNLLRLNLRGCTSITNLPASIGQSSRLEDLMMAGCTRLKELPKSVEQLKALVRLTLGGCRSLKAVPDTIGQLSRLESLDFRGCRRLDSLPESLGQLKAVVHLDLWGCSSLKNLPESIGALSNLRYLLAEGCTSLVGLPRSIRLCSALEIVTLRLSPECRRSFDGTVEGWTQLWFLKLRNCGGLESRVDYGAFKNLEHLTLEDNTLTELPESIGLLIGLRFLWISCERLQFLPKSVVDLKMLGALALEKCQNLTRLPKALGVLTSLSSLYVRDCPMSRLPSSIGQLSRLDHLWLSGCKNLQKLPTSTRRLGGLRVLLLRDCGSIEAMGALTTLQGLPIWGSTSTTKLPASLGIASTIVVCARGELQQFSDLLVGSSQVLEEDESGSLTAYYDGKTGVTSLHRLVHAARIDFEN